MFKKGLCTCIVFLFLSTLVIGQKVNVPKLPLHEEEAFQEMRQQVVNLFSPEAQIWIKTYQGTLNNIHEMQLILGFNGSVCRGMYFYPSSGIGFMLEGQETSTGLELMEVDQDENISAYIVLKNDEGILQGSWNHVEQDISISINLQEVKQLTEVISPCAENSWQRIYKGTLDDSKLSVNLQKESNVQALEVLLEIDGIPFRFNADCRTPECYNFIFDFSELSSLYNSLAFVLQDREVLNISAAHKDGTLSQVALNLDQEMEFECLNFVDYTTRFDLIYPILRNKAFDTWIDYRVNDWKNRINGEIKNLKIENPGEVPTDRFIFEAIGWVDIVYFSDKIVSGTLTFQKNWSSESERISFNYVINKKKHLSVSDLFDSKFDYDDYFTKFVKDQKENYVPFKEPILKNWIADQDFSHLNLTDEGIVLSTDFHTVFGSQKIVLPYTDVEKHLKKVVTKEFLK